MKICNVNSFHAQTHCLKKRMGYVHEDFAGLAYDRDGYDSDFSRRLAKTSSDSVYHGDGLIDVSNANAPLTTGNPSIASNGLVFAYRELKDNATNAATLRTVVTGANTLVGTVVTLTSVAAATRVDYTQSAVAVGDLVYVGTADGKLTYTAMVTTVTSAISLNVTILAIAIAGVNIVTDGVRLLAVSDNPAVTTQVNNQADPRNGKYLNNVLYQPPLGIFDISDPTILFGDMAIVLTPNQNYKTAVIESIIDRKEGTDYKFAIRSMKFYIAKCKIPQMPAPDTAFSMMEYQLLTKQLLIQSGTQNFDFMLPPSTQKIIVFIQDAAAGTLSYVNATRFKVRQFSDQNAITARYGNYSNTWDEFLQAIQVTFSGITKPQSMFQPLEEVKYNSNYMLQRWIHTNQMNRNPSPEAFEEWLSMGPYYAWDFSRDALSNGTYANVRVSYTPPTAPAYNVTPGNVPTVNLFIVAIHGRDVAIQYEQGRVVSVRSQIE